MIQLLLGEPIESTKQAQKMLGTSRSITLYEDDGRTYAYEKGVSPRGAQS